jgi:hypothetical protein
MHSTMNILKVMVMKVTDQMLIISMTMEVRKKMKLERSFLKFYTSWKQLELSKSFGIEKRSKGIK